MKKTVLLFGLMASTMFSGCKHDGTSSENKVPEFPKLLSDCIVEVSAENTEMRLFEGKDWVRKTFNFCTDQMTVRRKSIIYESPIYIQTSFNDISGTDTLEKAEAQAYWELNK